MQTVISIFDDHKAARRAVARLIEAGFPREHVHLHQGGTQGNSDAAGTPASTTGSDFDHNRGVLSSIGHFFASVFGQDPPSGYDDRYVDAARRGHCVLVVEVSDAEMADRTSTILRELGASEVDGVPASGQDTPRPARPASQDRVTARTESERAMAGSLPRETRTGESDIEARENRTKGDREFLP